MKPRFTLVGALVAVASVGSAQTPGPSLVDAKKAIAAAQAAAGKMNVNLGCVVMDSRGGVIVAERMENAGFYSIDGARGKALLSATFGAPSGAFTSLAGTGLGNVVPGPATALFMQGAVPLKSGGSIGCSGGTTQQDEDAAKAGAVVIK